MVWGKCMERSELDKLNTEELITLIEDYGKRFKMINELLMNYGQISNDDMLGLISKSIPDDFK